MRMINRCALFVDLDMQLQLQAAVYNAIWDVIGLVILKILQNVLKEPFNYNTMISITMEFKLKDVNYS